MSCPACRAPRSRPATRVREHDFRRCASCATLFCARPPDPEETRSLYAGDTYFANPEFGSPSSGGYHGYRDYLADRRHIEAKFADVLERVERLRAPGDLLDVGCGPGFLLSAALARGWRPVGLDVNAWAVSHARGLGFDARRQSLVDAGLPAASFDAVTMMDVLEHVADPERLVAEAARVTRPGGAIAVLTPDAGSPVSRALGGRWPELQRAPEHLVLFSARGLAALLSRCGYEPRGHHSVGKTSDVATLVADVAPTSPVAGRALAVAARALHLEHRTLAFDPRTKLCMYATLRA